MKIPPRGSDFAIWTATGNPWAPEHMARSVSFSTARKLEEVRSDKPVSSGVPHLPGHSGLGTIFGYANVPPGAKQ